MRERLARSGRQGQRREVHGRVAPLLRLRLPVRCAVGDVQVPHRLELL